MLTDKPRLPLREILLFGLWPGFIKKWIYRLKGYRIGKGVALGLGSVICADSVDIGEHTSIGFFTILRGREFRIGPHVQIGALTFIDTPYVHIGEGSKINEQVFVGGLQFPNSRFVMGRNCQIMQLSFINPARSIVIGDDSGIGGHCLVFGHNSFLSQFEGYAVDFEPIEIGNSVSLAWGVFVLPNTKIGDGAVIGARSLVRGTIPPRCLAAGFPARVISSYPNFPRHVTEDEKVTMFRNIVAEMIQFFTESGLQCRQDGNRYHVSTSARRRWTESPKHRGPWTLTVEDGALASCRFDERPAGGADVLLSLQEIPEGLRLHLQSRGIAWVEIARKQRSCGGDVMTDEVSNFLKRYGVRTLRTPSPSLRVEN
jgi:acetyltransferase-like isoleucine patch superfamily enzyme